MSTIENADNFDSQNISDKEKAKKLEKRRKYMKEHQKRFRQRRKLKDAVAKFINRMQTTRGVLMTRFQTVSVTSSLNQILRLRYRWTDKDLQRAWKRLKKLEMQVFERNYEDVPAEEKIMLDNFHNTMTAAGLDAETRVQYALELLRNETQELFLHKGDIVKPSPEMALCFLTQDMDYTVPEWFNKELLNLLYEKYKGTDFNKFMTTIRSKLQIRRMTENMKNLNKEIMEEELEE